MFSRSERVVSDPVFSEAILAQSLKCVNIKIQERKWGNICMPNLAIYIQVKEKIAI